MKIIKRDKSIEEFDISKITRVVQAAGLSKEQADELTKHIQEWMNALNSDIVVSDSLKEEVSKQIESFNKQAADMFKWYEETKYKK